MHRKWCKRTEFWSSRSITVLSLFAFIIVLCLILLSNCYMNICIEREANAQRNRIEFTRLGQTLANTSDYLTDEARKYAITGDIKHFYNYWNEIEVEKRRDSVIKILESYTPPQNEQILLEQAKQYSDLLVETETCSMKLLLLAQEKSLEQFIGDDMRYQFVQNVMNYDIPNVYKDLSKEEMRLKSQELLFDSNYQTAKSFIMNPIEEFQGIMNARLEQEANHATAGRRFASSVQVFCSFLVLFLTALLLIGMHRLYIRPLRSYTKQLSSVDTNDLTKSIVSPDGAYEPKVFGRMFNRLASELKHELDYRKKAEDEMRLARDEADKANSAKSEFLACMSHELRTPLNAIIGYLYLLDGSDLNETQRRYCDNIQLSSENLLGLINDVLDFSKIESGSMEFEHSDFDLYELMQSLQIMFANSAEKKGLYLKFDYIEAVPQFVRGDPLKLRQILMNLLSNAIKFTTNGGITVIIKSVDNMLCFSVQDTGIGIKQSEQYKIFHPFIQSDASVTRKYGGTGLGLSICKRIIETASDGQQTLELISQEGNGSCFSFCIKFQKAIKAKTERTITTVDIEEGKTLLLIDDNEINLTVEREIIERYGVSVTTAQSGAQALKIAHEKIFDMVLMDIRMPDMDGYKVARSLRKIDGYRCVPIIALSADAVTGVSEKVREAGMNHYATKPLRPTHLHRLLKKYFDLAVSEPELLATDKDCLFQMEQVIQNLGGNKEQVHRLIHKFLQSHRNDAYYIKTHLQNGYICNAMNILHDLIGISGNLCCDVLCAESRVFYNALKNGEQDNEERFQKVFCDTIDEIEEYASQIQCVAHKNSLSIEQTLCELTRLCNDFNISAIEIFLQEEQILQTHLSPELFDRLRETMQNYRFDEAIKVLKKVEGNASVSYFNS